MFDLRHLSTIMTRKTTLSPALVDAQARYRDGRRKLPGTLIPADVLAELERVQAELGTDKLAPAIWHVVREHERSRGEG